MTLGVGQVVHKGLWALYQGGSSSAIAAPDEAKCLRLLDAIDKAAMPDDLKIFAGFQQQPNGYSVSVNSLKRVFYSWTAGKANGINYV